MDYVGNLIRVGSETAVTTRALGTENGQPRWFDYVTVCITDVHGLP